MKIEIKVPSGGESVNEADIARWYNASGDHVLKDAPLVEFETDKSSLEVVAEASGFLEILHDTGETVDVGTVIGRIDTAAEAPAAKKAKPTKPGAAAPASPAPAPQEPAPPPPGQAVAEEADPGKTSAVMDPTMPSPAARKMMFENRLSALDIDGSGPHGHITKADVLHHLERVHEQALQQHHTLNEHPLEGNTPIEAMDETLPLDPPSLVVPSIPPVLPAAKFAPPPVNVAAAPAAESAQAETRGSRRQPMSRLRKTIASRLVESQQTTASLTTFNEIDMSAIMGIRSSYKESFKKKHEIGLGFMSFFIKAVTQALAEFPDVNASVDGNEIVYHDYCDVGIAVSTPKGLVVPVIRSAEAMPFHQVEQTVMDLALKGRDGKLSLDDLSGGTFTITNGGTFGSMLSTPIINPPQSAILGMHNIVQRPVAVDGEVVIRPIMYVALSYDHRIIDGSGAVRFLVKIKELCEDPTRILLEL